MAAPSTTLLRIASHRTDPRFARNVARGGRIRSPEKARGIGEVEAMGLEPTNLLTASQALYQLSYAPSGGEER